MNVKTRNLALAAIVLLLAFLGWQQSQNRQIPAQAIARDGVYTQKEDVAAYLAAYGELPGNFITKAEARALGWSGGDLRPYAQDTAIGGDRFGNLEGLLPKMRGRVYYECDVNTLNQPSRGAERIVYSNDGLIFYTGDHYASFEQLHGVNDEGD